MGDLVLGSSLELLEQAAAKLMELTREEELFNFICEEFAMLSPDSIVIAGGYDEKTQSLVVESAAGVERQIGEVARKLGSELLGFTLPLNLTGSYEPPEGKLLYVEGRLSDVVQGSLSAEVCDELQNLLKLQDLYLLRFIREGRLFGYALIGIRENNRLQNAELIETLAILASVALQRIHAETALIQENEASADISRSLLSTLDLNQLLDGIVKAAIRLIPVTDRAVIHLYNAEEHSLELIAAAGVDMPEGKTFKLQAGQGVAGKVLEEGRTINVADISDDPDYLPLGAENPLRSLMVAPIRSMEHLLGTISVRSKLVHAFTPENERALTLLGLQAALAINNARLFNDERRFRQMAENLLLQEKARRMQYVQSEKLAALGRIVASVAHELNNPLQAIQNALYLVQLEQNLNPQTREDLRVALNETNRMADLISRLRETYRPPSSEEFIQESLNALVTEIQRLLSTHLRHHQVTFHFEPDPDLPPIQIIRDQVRQVILNLCLNAIEAMTAGGKLTVTTLYRLEEKEVLLSFSDTGPGIPEDILPYIFDPFFTTKEGGTGLGLSITYDIIQRHRGRIEISSSEGKGTMFQVYLPMVQELQEEEPLPRRKRVRK
jgi:signal transduction histidine kinase